MKQYLIIAAFAMLMGACSAKKEWVQVPKKESPQIVKDTVEYELITFDSWFETWYEQNNSPSMYRSNTYYESWNKRYVSAWNSKTGQDLFFEPIVGYDYSVDYGIELNHKLFYYFQYVEKKLKKPILPGNGPQLLLLD